MTIFSCHEFRAFGFGAPLFRACFPKPCYLPLGMLDCPHRFTRSFLAFIFMVSFIVTLSHLYWCCCNDSSTRYVWVAFTCRYQNIRDNARCVYLPLVNIVVFGRRLLNTTTSRGRLCLCSMIEHFDFFPYYSLLNHPKLDESGNCALRLTVVTRNVFQLLSLEMCPRAKAHGAVIPNRSPRALISGFTRKPTMRGGKAPMGPADTDFPSAISTRCAVKLEHWSSTSCWWLLWNFFFSF